MRNFGLKVCLAISLALLTACESIPPLNFSVPNVGPSARKLDAEVRSMTVTLARPDERSGDMPLGIETLAPIWQTALQEALNRMVIFKDESPRKVSLSVKILKMDIPAAGASFTSEASARYEIIDRNNGDIIYSQDVHSSGTTPMDFAFLGVARARESVNRAVQNNISLFLQALETVDLSKPMFPAGSPAPASKAPTS